MPIKLDSLTIKGYNDRNIMNSLLIPRSASGPISVILPGLHYTVDMPMLYYATGILLEAGHSVLTVDTRYSGEEEFMSVSNQERAEWMFRDAEAVYEAIQDLENYTLSVIVGKSLGTIMMSRMVQKYPEIADKKILWLTPLLKQEWVVEQMIAHKGNSLVVIGTADPHYDDNIIAKLAQEGKCEVFAVLKGNHSLDVPAGVLSSMEQLSNIMAHFKTFIQ